MKKQLFNALMNENMEEVCKEMILPKKYFIGDVKAYEVDLNRDAINVEDLTINIDVWMKNMLEFDKNSNMFNRIIRQNSLNNNYLWDCEFIDLLNELGFDIELIISEYTYNDSDYNRLNRDIQYSIFEYDGEYYIAFSVHYGSDARAGFGDLACFKISDINYFHESMTIKGWVKSEDKNLEWYEIEEVATYDKESNTWIHNETGEEIELDSLANGF